MRTNNIKFLALGLAGALILSITIILIAIPLVQSGNDLRDAEMTYAATTKQLETVLSNRAILYMSAQENLTRGDKRLFHCLDSAGTCDAANTKNFFKFRQGLDPALPLVGGDQEHPVRVPWNHKCMDLGCPAWEIRTWFKPRCPGAALTCERAESIEVGFNIDGVDSKLEHSKYLALKSDISLIIQNQ